VIEIHFQQNAAVRPAASMTAMAMAAATAATAAPAAGFFNGGRFVAGPGGCESGKFLVEPGRAAVRTIRAAPLGGTDEDFGIAFALGAMEFVDWHGAN
jgi:hypothetical protein